MERFENLAVQGGPPVRDKYLPYGRQWLDEEDIQAVVDVLRGDYLTTGPAIEALEQAIAAYTGASYAVAFANGTAALHGACFAAGIGPGDEVITSPLTFAASANCILYVGGTPVFADIDPRTLNIDPTAIEKVITPRTKAILPVDFAGNPVNLEAIQALARKHHLVVIEDAAHALGASYQNRKVGSLSDMTMFSFHPVKSITAAEGGIITTDREDYCRKLKLFRAHGITREKGQLLAPEGPWYYEMQHLGYNYRMTDLQAALGLSQLRKLDSFVRRRQALARSYTRALQEMKEVLCPPETEKGTSAWHLYVLRLQLERLAAGRREIFQALLKENIGVNVHYIPVYYHPYYQDLGYAKGLCPQAEKYYEQAVTLPLFPAMTDQDLDDVIRALKKVITYYRG